MTEEGARKRRQLSGAVAMEENRLPLQDHDHLDTQVSDQQQHQQSPDPKQTPQSPLTSVGGNDNGTGSYKDCYLAKILRLLGTEISAMRQMR